MGEGGALGKYTGKIKHSKIKKYEENPFAGFFNATIVGKIF